MQEGGQKRGAAGPPHLPRPHACRRRRRRALPRPPALLALLCQGVNLDDKVGQHMSTPPIVARPGQRTGEAAAIMLARKIHRLPVVNEEGQLIG